MPELWVVGGPNGAGKSSILRQLSPQGIEIVSPDTIALELGVDDTAAGRLALAARKRLLFEGKSFCADTTFSGNSELGLLRSAKIREWSTSLIYVGVDNPGISRARIRARVARGEHDVPQRDVIRRFTRSQDNLWRAFDIPDRVCVLDNTGPTHRVVLLSLIHI